MTPFGYRIKDGKAVVDGLTAKQVRALFEGYISGLSMNEAARRAGLKRCHASIGIMLRDKRYAGGGFYPQIIDGDLFENVQEKRIHRAEASGKVREPQTQERFIPTLRFHASAPEQRYNDPFKQAEYAYSLIECEAVADE
jgi:hypothetical protein